MLKVTKNQAFTLSLENTVLTTGGSQIDPFLGCQGFSLLRVKSTCSF